MEVEFSTKLEQVSPNQYPPGVSWASGTHVIEATAFIMAINTQYRSGGDGVQQETRAQCKGEASTQLQPIVALQERGLMLPYYLIFFVC